MNQTANRILLSLMMLTGFIVSDAQTYISLAPSISNQAGSFADKINLGLEVGRQWDVFSVGVVVAKNSLQKAVGRDTTTYFELRPNLNVFQQGKFTNTFTAGIGYIINAKENLLTELTYGIEYAYSPQIHFNVYFGQYYYSGRYSDSNSTFFGISCMYYFSPNNSKPLIRNGNQQ
ncbi:MAG TPA: hypothetical protein VFI33_14285 [Puia sp.]|nr:hypothetical protein [Puia sp.]